MPQQQHLNVAARAARWSASHWKTTVAGQEDVERAVAEPAALGAPTA
jgi:hypothetical protein